MSAKFKPMIGAQPRTVTPGGFITGRSRPHRKMSMDRVKKAATSWLNVRGPEIQHGVFNIEPTRAK